MIDLLKALILPSNLAIVAIAVGTAMLFSERFRGAAKALLVVAVSVLVICSTGVMATALLSPLEYRYPFVKNPDSHPEIKTIVVLTGYSADYPLVPLSSKVNSASAFRLLEAQRLSRHCPECEIVISGSALTTRLMKQLLASMGVPAEKIREDGASAHTYISARTMSRWLGREPFYLVTSAGHMPRAMGVFEKQGLNPVPAPTDYQLPNNILNAGLHLSPQHLNWCNLAVHEYAGIAWYRLTDKM